MSLKGEKIAIRRATSNVNMCVPLYIMAAYAYYVEDNPIFEDNFYDKLARKILKNWDAIDHYHKDYLTKDAVEAGTYLGDYPPVVPGAVRSWREQFG